MTSDVLNLTRLPPADKLIDVKPNQATATIQAEADLARQILQAEAGAISQIVIDDSFHQAVDLVTRSTDESAGGSLVVSGLGKSGLIGQKLSATFASTGTPSHFLHPAEAMHGDLGRIRESDVVLLLSYTGGTEEVLALAAILRQDGVKTIAMTARPASELGKLATLALPIGDITEACPHKLAPTASTTAMLALGDALALCVSQRRAFGVDDFRKRHPGGSLGRQLMSVVDAMRFKAGQNLPLVTIDQTIQQAYDAAEQTAKATGLRRAGALLVTDHAGKLAGIFTDGDLRRLVFRKPGESVLGEKLKDVMTVNPRHLTNESLVRDAVQLTREFRIDEIPVVDAKGQPLGLIDVQDLMALKVIEGT